MLPLLNGSNRNSSERFSISDASQISDARRNIVARAADIGFPEARRNDIAIAVNEIGTNLLKHAKGGDIIIRLTPSSLDVLGIDKGPGRDDIDHCMQDGFSTGSSPGTGLGAMRRLASDFDIWSRHNQGTAVSLQFSLTPEFKHVRLGAVSLPVEGEQLCGDGWLVLEQADRTLALIADGLGHGPDANKAAREAMRLTEENAQRAPLEILDAIHAGLRSTRGAAVLLAAIDPARGVVRIAGIGNCCAAIVRPEKQRSAVSMNGTAGQGIVKAKEFTYPWLPEDTLILHTDGLTTHWDLDKYPGILMRSPALAAGVLHRDFARARDDATVISITLSSTLGQ